MLEKWDKHMPKTNNSMHSLLHVLEITEVRPKTRKVFPCGSAGKESGFNAGDLDLIPGLGRSPGKGKGYLLQYSGLENPMEREAWRAAVHGVTKESDMTE